MIRIFNHYFQRRALLQAVADLGLFALVMLTAAAVQAGGIVRLFPAASTHILSLAAGMVVIGSASGIYQQSPRATAVQTFARAVVMLLFALPLTFLATGFLAPDLAERPAIQLAGVLGIGAVVLRRAYLLHWGAQPRASSRVLVFGSGAAAQVVGETLRKADPQVELVGYLSGPNEREVAVRAAEILPGERSLIDTATALGVDEIVVALTERRAGSMPLRQLLDCKLQGIKVYDLAGHFEKRLGQIRIDFVNAGWLVFGDGFNQGALRGAIKRVSDIVLAAVLIAVAAPVMLLTALAIRLDSRGPVFYRQERVGLNGRTFMVTKFRSMRADAERDGRPRWASATDDRITRVGNVIRKVRIDELPQLFDVLRGDMSLVGPRPERPYFVEQLTREIPYYAARHSVKPGVTGWAQVRYQYGSSVEDAQEKLQYDLYYVKNMSGLLDIDILLSTIRVVLFGKGAR